MAFDIKAARERSADSKGRFERVVKGANIQTMLIEGCKAPKAHSFHMRLSQAEYIAARGIADGLDISVACLFRLLLAEAAKGNQAIEDC